MIVCPCTKKKGENDKVKHKRSKQKHMQVKKGTLSFFSKSDDRAVID
jgi:hypothetical protein